jgi:hypothetical protein
VASGNLIIVDISDPAEPLAVGRLSTGPFTMMSVAVGVDVAYMGGTESGLHVLDVSDPLAPAYVGGVNPTSSYAFISDAVVAGNHLYAAFSGRFVIFPAQCPGTMGVSAGTTPPPAPLALRQNVPNPFNPTTSIAFELPAAAHVTLSIYDASGRVVRTLAEGGLPAGVHRFDWDSRDANGRELSSGVYFCRLRVNDRELARKLVLLN